MQHEPPVVILVEDNPDHAFIVQESLRALALPLKTFTSGWAAATFAEQYPDLLQATQIVLLDINLKAEDGFNIFRHLRTLPSLAQAKFVACTADTRPEHVAQARAAGFDAFIGKPVHVDRFPEQLTRIIQGAAVWEPR